MAAKSRKLANINRGTTNLLQTNRAVVTAGFTARFRTGRGRPMKRGVRHMEKKSKAGRKIGNCRHAKNSQGAVSGSSGWYVCRWRTPGREIEYCRRSGVCLLHIACQKERRPDSRPKKAGWGEVKGPQGLVQKETDSIPKTWRRTDPCDRKRF